MPPPGNDAGEDDDSSRIRADDLLFPEGATRLEPGDLVSALVHPSAADRLRELLRAPRSTGDDVEGEQPMELI